MTEDEDEAAQPDSYLLPEEENRRIFLNEILPKRLQNLRGVANPSLHYFCGQPGAGKSTAQTFLRREVLAHDGQDTVASVDIDEYRIFHPAYVELLDTDEKNAGARTNEDAWRWKVQAVDYIQQLESKPHVFEAGTLRDPGSVIAQIRRYQQIGFSTVLHVIAINGLLSRERMLCRYLNEVEVNGCGRMVPRGFHDSTYEKLVDSVAEVLHSGVVERVVIHNSDSEKIFDNGKNPLSDDVAQAAVDTLIQGQKISPEQLLWLQERVRTGVERAHEYGCQDAETDLSDLLTDVDDALRTRLTRNA